MLFVSDSFELTQNKVIVLTAFYPQTKLTNTGNTTANLLKSKDGVDWVALTTLAPEQSTTITLDNAFMYLTFKEDTVVYFQSETPNYQHTKPSTDNSNSSIDTTEILRQVNELIATKADKNSTENELSSLQYAIQQYNNDYINLASSLGNELKRFIGLDKADKLTQAQKNKFLATMQLLTTTSFSEYVAENIESKLMYLEKELGKLQDNSSQNLLAEVNRLSSKTEDMEKQLVMLNSNLAIKSITSGTIDLTSPASSGEGNSRQWDITFDTPFTKTPVIAYAPSTPHNRIHYIKNVSTTGFTYMTNYVDYQASITWVAFIPE